MDKGVIEVNNLTKEYKKLKAVDGLSFTVYKGEILGLLGPNGSGKSTTLICILSLLNFSKGSIKIFYKEMKPDAYEIKKEIGYSKDYIVREITIDKKKIIILFNEVLTSSTDCNEFILERLTTLKRKD